MSVLCRALRNAFSQRQHQLLSTGRPLLLQAVARFNNENNPPSCQVFVGGLAWGTNEQSLRDAFSSFGEVIDARVITDRETGRSRGFGFVRFTSVADAEAAIEQMNGRDLGGRNVRVNFATERTPIGGMGRFGGGDIGYNRSPPGDGYGGGSYGGSRGSSFGGGNDDTSYDSGGPSYGGGNDEMNYGSRGSSYGSAIDDNNYGTRGSSVAGSDADTNYGSTTSSIAGGNDEDWSYGSRGQS
eukprot:c19536_g1_i1 orf=431-1153(-)